MRKSKEDQEDIRERLHQAIGQLRKDVTRVEVWATALRQYLRILAGEAQLVGVSLDANESPLVQ